jgi:hypothetical protein
LGSGPADSFTSSTPAGSLNPTESIDFAARTYGSMMTAGGTVTPVTLMDPGESITPAGNLIEDFL